MNGDTFTRIANFFGVPSRALAAANPAEVEPHHGEAELLECPAGRMDGTNPREDAIRELWEEVGLRLTHLEPLATAWMMPGVSTERIHLFLAPYTSADRTGAGGGLDSENERITVDEMALADLAAMADEGRLTDMKTLALVQTLRLRHPELFAG